MRLDDYLATGRPIALTGATGTVGSTLLERLRKRGVPVRALARSARAVLQGCDGVEAVDCDLHDARAAREAFSGCGAMFLLTPLEPEMPEVGARLVAAACDAGVQRIVRLSAFGAGDAEPNTLGRVHRSVEQAVESSGAEWTVLRPNSFMQNFAVYCAHGIRAAGLFRMPQGEGAVSVVDARDVAAAAERALLEPGHCGRTYELTGPAAIDNHEVAVALAGALGEPVRYVDIAESEARDELLGAGLPVWLTGVIMELYAMCKAGRASRVDGALPEILGRPATPFADYASARREDYL